MKQKVKKADRITAVEKKKELQSEKESSISYARNQRKISIM